MHSHNYVSNPGQASHKTSDHCKPVNTWLSPPCLQRLGPKGTVCTICCHLIIDSSSSLLLHAPYSGLANTNTCSLRTETQLCISSRLHKITSKLSSLSGLPFIQLIHHIFSRGLRCMFLLCPNSDALKVISDSTVHLLLNWKPPQRVFGITSCC